MMFSRECLTLRKNYHYKEMEILVTSLMSLQDSRAKKVIFASGHNRTRSCYANTVRHSVQKINVATCCSTKYYYECYLKICNVHSVSVTDTLHLLILYILLYVHDE